MGWQTAFMITLGILDNCLWLGLHERFSSRSRATDSQQCTDARLDERACGKGAGSRKRGQGSTTDNDPLFPGHGPATVPLPRRLEMES